MLLRRLLCAWVTISFLITLIVPPQESFAQTILNLPKPGVMVSLSPAYTPVLIKGLKINPTNPLALDFIVAPGDSRLTAQDPALKKESEKLIKYFFAALTLPEKEVWVNLSPYEKNRIIPKSTGETEMGRDMLAQDYMLKQITASLIYPEQGLGKDFWNKVYTEAYQRFGTSQVPVNTFNKVWIVADKASVYEAKDTVFVVESHLKVMLEEDYLALEKHGVILSAAKDPKTSLSSQLVRQIILPALEKEVNQGKNFANLRQIFHSLILAKWYKETLKAALLNQVYSNKDKVAGLSFPNVIGNPQYIYQQYLKAYKKGVFNYIKEDIDQATQQPIPRKYFSGGVLGTLKRIDRATIAQAREAAGGEKSYVDFAVTAHGTDAAMSFPFGGPKSVLMISQYESEFATIEKGKNFHSVNFNERQITAMVPDPRIREKLKQVFAGKKIRISFSEYFMTIKVQRLGLKKLETTLDLLAEYANADADTAMQAITTDKETVEHLLPFLSLEYKQPEVIEAADLYLAEEKPDLNKLLTTVMKYLGTAQAAQWFLDAVKLTAEHKRRVGEKSKGEQSRWLFNFLRENLTTILYKSHAEASYKIMEHGVDSYAEAERIADDATEYARAWEPLLFPYIHSAALQTAKHIGKEKRWFDFSEYARFFYPGYFQPEPLKQISQEGQINLILEIRPGGYWGITIKENEFVGILRELAIINMAGAERFVRTTLQDEEAVSKFDREEKARPIKLKAVDEKTDFSLTNFLPGAQVPFEVSEGKSRTFILRNDSRALAGQFYRKEGIITVTFFKKVATASELGSVRAVRENVIVTSHAEHALSLSVSPSESARGLDAGASPAMKTHEDKKATVEVEPGGIDFNTSRLKMQKTGSGVNIQFDPAAVAEFKRGNFAGIIPVITRITAVDNIYSLLGLHV